MAQLLFERDSTGKHLNAVRRHIRATKKVKGAEALADAIQPYHAALEQKKDERLAKVTAREDANDDLAFADVNLDNAIRTTFERFKQYDRENPTDRSLAKVFPDETFGDIIRLPIKDEPGEVEAIAIRIDKLGESHPLAGEAVTLRALAAESNAAIGTLQAAIREEKAAEAEEEIAQADLRRQYENNYLDARKLFGRQVAEQFFPKLSGSSSKTIDVGEEEITE